MSLQETFNLDPASREPVRAVILETADAAAGITTTYSMAPGDTFSGTLDAAGDRDWVAVTLTAGEIYQISLTGVTLSDPYLYVYDSAGVLVAANDDFGGSPDSGLTYTATTTGTYYVAAAAYGDGGSGTYSMEVQVAAPADLATLAAYLTDGFWTYFGGGPRAFDTSVSNQITVNLTGLTADGMQLARWALEAWENVADIVFVEVTGSADITFDDNQSGAYSSSTVAGNVIQSSIVNISTNWISSYGTTIDSYSFQTYMHEIGHALGLGHQGGYNGSATYGVDNDFINDSWQESVMSYFSQTENTSITASYAYLSTTMMADVVAIQNLYGAAGKGSATWGNTVWGANSNLPGYLGDLFSAMNGGPTAGIYAGNAVAYTIYDAKGVDTIDLSTSTFDNRIDLRAGLDYFSDINGGTGNLGIAPGTVIERAIGGSGNDTIIGNDVANKLLGGAGDDVLIGMAGNDRLIGQSGADTLSGGGGKDSLAGKGGADTLNGGGGKDKLNGGRGNDQLNGDGGNDVLRGNGGKDILNGGYGDDTLIGGGGADVFVWSSGNDTVTDFNATKPNEVIDLSGAAWASSYADLVNNNNLSQVGADVLIDDGAGNTMLLLNVALADLDASDFLF